MILRFFLRMILGKRRRDMIMLNSKLDFAKFLYIILKFFHLNNLLLLRIHVSKLDYKFWCRINREDFTYMTIHKDDVIELFQPVEGNVVLDVGAHIGLYTILGSKFVGPSGKVISIEPDPRNFQILVDNVKLNELTNIRAFNYAAYSQNTKMKLYLPEKETGYTIYNTLIPDRANRAQQYLMVNVRTLDELITLSSVKVTDIKWIKIDVEGAELEVLIGASNILLHSRNIFVLIEIHSTRLYQRIKELLSTYGFKIEFEKWNREKAWGHVLFHKVT
jgi:FkbM family methyltransferase